MPLAHRSCFEKQVKTRKLGFSLRFFTDLLCDVGHVASCVGRPFSSLNLILWKAMNPYYVGRQHRKSLCSENHLFSWLINVSLLLSPSIEPLLFLFLHEVQGPFHQSHQIPPVTYITPHLKGQTQRYMLQPSLALMSILSTLHLRKETFVLCIVT